MKKKTSISVMIVLIALAIFLGVLLVNKGDGPVMGMMLAEQVSADTDSYDNMAKTRNDGVYLVISVAYNKFRKDYETSVPKEKDLYALIHVVECPKGSEFTGKWIKDGKEIKTDTARLTTEREGVLSYLLDANEIEAGNYSFLLYNGDTKILEQAFSVK